MKFPFDFKFKSQEKTTVVSEVKKEEMPKMPTEPKEPAKSSKSTKPNSCYNLIILDESGSMACVAAQTINGCNETLTTIRKAESEDALTQNYVSIFCFDSDLKHSRYIVENTAIENVEFITEEDYQPGGGTPLNDAIGHTCSRLHTLIKDDKSASVVVTIITDGEENSSTHFTHAQVKSLIEQLKEEGWVFTFIGANIDAKATAMSFSIESSFQFVQTEEGMNKMWELERKSRERYHENLRRMKGANYESDDERRRAMRMLNSGYFEEFSRITPRNVSQLKGNEVFVFGSNLAGQHMGGAARVASSRFGAVFGQGVGLQGQSYAIPTMQGGVETIKPYVDEFAKFADAHPELNFFVTRIGCGIAGFSDEEIAPLFAGCISLPNVALPQSFWNVLKK